MSPCSETNNIYYSWSPANCTRELPYASRNAKMGPPFGGNFKAIILAHFQFERSPVPGGESDSFGLQGGGSSLEQAGFSRSFWAALRPRLPLRKRAGWTWDNPFPPGFLIHRPPRRAVRVGKNWGWAKGIIPLTNRHHFHILIIPKREFLSNGNQRSAILAGRVGEAKYKSVISYRRKTPWISD